MDEPKLGRLRALLQNLREDLESNGGAPLPFVWRDVAVIALTCALLTIFYYYARPNFYRANLHADVVALLGMEKSAFRTILPYWYWSFSSLTLRVLIPLGCIIFWFKESPRDYGFQLWKKGHGKIYLGMYLFMLPLLVAVSFDPGFQSKYPFYADASKSWTHLILYELAYGVQFASLEAFFRGFIIFALFKRFGYQAVMIMTIPYCLIHFGKPPAETLGAIAAGMALGFMAIKSKSWLPGALLHWSVGFTMDALCILHKGVGAS